MRCQHVAFAFALLLSGCVAADDKSSATTEPSGAASVAAAGASDAQAAVPKAASGVVMATASIASVQLKQDCPDAKMPVLTPAKAPAGAPAKAPAGLRLKTRKAAPVALGKRSISRGDTANSAVLGSRARGRRQAPPCSQSTLQLSFTGQTGGSSVVAIRDVRLKSAEGRVLGSLATRMPSVWRESGYVPWDGTIEPGPATKVSYKISVPDWRAIEATLAGPSYGRLYTVEVDLEILGKLTTLNSAPIERSATVKSPQFERGRPQNIRT